MSQESGEVIKVIIVDDHVLYRAGVKTALLSRKDIKIIAEADNGSHLLNMLMELHTDPDTQNVEFHRKTILII